MSRITTLALGALALLGATTPLAAQPVGEAAVPKAARVEVDLSRSRGPLLRTERLNTWDNGDPEPEMRKADMAFLADKGLAPALVRVGIEIGEETCHMARGVCDFSGTPWLADVAGWSGALVVHLTPEGLFAPGGNPDDLVPRLTLAIRELKRQFPNVAYVEAFNEPDWVNHVMQVRTGKPPQVTPEGLYAWYLPFYKAVNAVNRDLLPHQRIRLGGPTLMSFDHKGWIPAFLNGYAADPDPAKRLDFLSWHAYGYFDESTGYRAYRFFKTDPTLVASQRARVDEMLAARGLPTSIPVLVTETGVYPGPAFDDRDPSRNDWTRQAPGIAALHYWYAEQDNIYPFHWTVRHDKEGRKDQLVTLRGETEDSPPATFTPYGNALLMQSMLRDERVVATSDALVGGKGVYAIATKGGRGAAVMIWNYQGMDTQAFDVTLDLAGFPAKAQAIKARQSQYRIDAQTSNYWADPAKAQLQQVGETMITLGTGQQLRIALPPNAMHLVVLDIQSSHVDGPGPKAKQ